MNYENYIKDLMSEKRYIHSLGVRDEAMRLAKLYGADLEKAYLAGLLHDITKDFTFEQSVELAEKYGVKLEEIDKVEHKLVHGHIGAYYVKNELGIDDDEIFEAIYYHTTSKAGMRLLTKIIYIADIIEPNRTYNGVETLRALAYSDLDKAVFNGLRNTIIKLTNNGRMLHTETVNAMNDLIIKGCKL